MGYDPNWGHRNWSYEEDEKKQEGKPRASEAEDRGSQSKEMMDHF